MTDVQISPNRYPFGRLENMSFRQPYVSRIWLENYDLMIAKWKEMNVNRGSSNIRNSVLGLIPTNENGFLLNGMMWQPRDCQPCCFMMIPSQDTRDENSKCLNGNLIMDSYWELARIQWHNSYKYHMLFHLGNLIVIKSLTSSKLATNCT